VPADDHQMVIASVGICWAKKST